MFELVVANMLISFVMILIIEVVCLRKENKMLKAGLDHFNIEDEVMEVLNG